MQFYGGIYYIMRSNLSKKQSNSYYQSGFGKLHIYANGRVTMNFIENIKERAKQDVKTIVLPESNDRRSLIAAAKILEEGIANLIMIGKEEKIMDGARWLEVDLSKIKVVDPETSDKFEEYAQKLPADYVQKLQESDLFRNAAYAGYKIETRTVEETKESKDYITFDTAASLVPNKSAYQPETKKDEEAK